MTQEALYLTPRQVAELLTSAGIATTEDTTRRWARCGLINSIKMPGGQYRIKRDDVEALIKGEPTPARAA